MKRLLLVLLTILLMSFTINPVQAQQFVDDLIVTSPTGIWTDNRAYSTIADAVSAIGTTDQTLVIASAQTVVDLDVPENISLRFERTGMITYSGHLNIHGTDIVANNHQIFNATGAGEADFGHGTNLRSSWFEDLHEMFDQTVDNYVTCIIDSGWAANIDADCQVGDNVNLKWEGPGNRLVINAGFTLSNIKNIDAGNYRILSGSGDFDFLDGTNLKLSWFNNLRSVLTWVEDEEVTIIISGTNTVDYNSIATANENFDFISEQGILSISAGVTLTIYSADNINASKIKQIKTGTGLLTFTKGDGISYAGWWAGPPSTTANQSLDHTSELHEFLNSGSNEGQILGEGYYMVDCTSIQSGQVKAGLNIPSNYHLSLSPSINIQQLNEATDDAYNIFVIYNKSNIIIDGNGANLIGDSDYSASKPGASFNGIGIRVQGSTNVSIHEVTSTKMWADGFVIMYDNVNSPYPESVNINLINCIATNNYRNGASIIGAIDGGIYGGSYNYSSGTAPQDGILIEPNADKDPAAPVTPSVVRDFIIDGVTARNNTKNGIEAYGAGTVTGITITNCQSYSNGQDGIIYRNASKGIITNNHTYSNTAFGISTYHVNNTEYNGNNSHDNASGMVVQNPSTVTTSYLNIVGNKLHNNTNSGLWLYGTAGKILYYLNVSANSINSNGTDGILASYIQESNISNNILVLNSQTTDNTSDNITLSNCDGVLISGNVVRHGGGAKQAAYGIDIPATNSNCRIFNNDIRASGKTLNVNNLSTTSTYLGTLRSSTLIINDGTNASTINCTLSSTTFGDAIGATNNIAKNATTGNYTLSADGAQLIIENAGLLGTVMIVTGGNVKRNLTTIDVTVNAYLLNGDIVLYFFKSSDGSVADLTALADTGQLQVQVFYMLDY